jgi:hypothetical protein
MTANTEGSDQADAGQPTSQPAEELLLMRARVHYAITVVVGVFVFFLGLGVLALLAVPLAHAIAGQHTQFEVSVSLSVGATLATSTALATGGLIIQSRRANRYKKRTMRLETTLGYRGDNQRGHERQAAEQVGGGGVNSDAQVSGGAGETQQVESESP